MRTRKQSKVDRGGVVVPKRQFVFLNRWWVVRSPTNLNPSWSEASSTTKVARDFQLFSGDDGANELFSGGRLRWATASTTCSQATKTDFSQVKKSATWKVRGQLRSPSSIYTHQNMSAFLLKLNDRKGKKLEEGKTQRHIERKKRQKERKKRQKERKKKNTKEEREKGKRENSKEERKKEGREDSKREQRLEGETT